MNKLAIFKCSYKQTSVDDQTLYSGNRNLGNLRDCGCHNLQDPKVQVGGERP